MFYSQCVCVDLCMCICACVFVCVCVCLCVCVCTSTCFFLLAKKNYVEDRHPFHNFPAMDILVGSAKRWSSNNTASKISTCEQLGKTVIFSFIFQHVWFRTSMGQLGPGFRGSALTWVNTRSQMRRHIAAEAVLVIAQHTAELNPWVWVGLPKLGVVRSHWCKKAREEQNSARFHLINFLLLMHHCWLVKGSVPV